MAAGLAALLPALGLTTVVSRAERADRAEAAARCERAAVRAEERRSLDTGRGADVVVIGDSYAVGAGSKPALSWPRRLPGRVHVDGFSGSGFSEEASPCGAVSYADRAPTVLAGHPGAVVVVQGGLNDHRQGDAAIERGFARLVQALAGHDVVVVGPPPAPDRILGVARVDALLSRLTSAAGVPYVSMLRADLDYLPDGLHPTPLGHREFGDLVAPAVARLLPGPSAQQPRVRVRSAGGRGSSARPPRW